MNRPTASTRLLLIASTRLLLFFCFSLFAASGFAQSVSKPEALQDAMLELKEYSLYVDHRPVVENVGSLGGKVLWFCLPDQGQFIISTTAHKGFDFKKVGTIKGNTISFRHNDKVYEWVSKAQVVSDGTEKELWLMVGGNYLRKDCLKGACFGSASLFEALLGRR